ncbi:MAG: winged helix-turn-helix transcriptional regulator [Verrucomicrobiales bacterium]|nr:winged helix-turn-helix transcriptional regulator [Verrucomicrobiales bacterium]
MTKPVGGSAGGVHNAAVSGSANSPCTPFLKALADENRWRLVQLLLGGGCTVSDLVTRSGLSQYNVSKHLRVLRESGIAETEREGKFVYYRIAVGFQTRVSADGRSLNLGCCTFHFDRGVERRRSSPKSARKSTANG